MLDKLQLTEYKQAIAESYDLRSHCYDDSDWQLQVCSQPYERIIHRYHNSNWRLQICWQLLTYSQIESEQCILDIGTGTGHLAIGAAKIVEIGRASCRERVLMPV